MEGSASASDFTDRECHRWWVTATATAQGAMGMCRNGGKKKHCIGKERKKSLQMALEERTENEPEEAWYKDETDEFQEKLMDYHHR